MDSVQSHEAGGSLQISSEVIEKIARLAALEVEGVSSVSVDGTAGKKLLNKLTPQKAIVVEMNDDVADIEVSLIVAYGTKIPELSERVQLNIKNSVQNMTSITVGRVDIVVTGISSGDPQE